MDASLRRRLVELTFGAIEVFAYLIKLSLGLLLVWDVHDLKLKYNNP